MRRHELSRWIAAAALAAACAAPAAAAAQSSRVAMSVASARARMETEAEARQRVEALFDRLCPGRCELLRVEATVGRSRSITALEPGFEDDAPQAYDSPVQAVNVEILLDAALPASFRQNMPRMLRYQLQSLAETIEVRAESLAFPEPQLEPTPPVLRDPPAYPMMPRALPAPEPVAPAAAPEAPEAHEAPTEAPDDASADLWARAVPWIGGVLIALILAALILVLLWRLTRPARSAPSDAPATPAGAPPRGDDARLEARVREVLAEQRGASNAALRRWLSEDPERVAGFVQIFGVDAVRDLRGVDSLEGALERLGEALIAHPEPPTCAARRALVLEATARFSAAELAETRGPGWDFLDGLSTAQLGALLESLSADERSLVLAETSPHARAQLLASLGATQRSDLLLAAAEDADLPLAERRRLRLRVRARAADVQSETSRDSGSTRFGVDLLRVADGDEQLALARRFASEHPRRSEALLEQVLLERALAHLPAGVLPDAATGVPLDALVAFLRGADAATREWALEQLPPRLRPAAVSELEAGGAPVSRARFIEARAALIESAERVLRRDGLAIAEINARALGSERRAESLFQREAAE